MKDIIRVNDIDFSIPFQIYDCTTDRYIFSIMDESEGGDIPPDIAMLPASGMVVDKRNGMTTIDVETA